jgi:uncharacterized protein YndB with AHSA1/START domain
MNNPSANQQVDFMLIHEFNAPKELVFNAFGDAAALNEWWGPLEMKNSVISLDFRPGGIFHFKMEHPGETWYGRFLFKTIQPHDLLEFSNAFADEQARVVKAPFDFSFPLEILYRIVFTEKNGKTTLTVTGQPLNAGPEETAAYQSINSDMQRGWAATFDKLTAYLNK